MSAIPQLELPCSTANGRARAAALDAAGAHAPGGGAHRVEYRSAGRVLVLGDAPTAAASVRALSARLDCVLLLPPGAAPPSLPGVPVVAAPLRALSGHLGAFEARVAVAENEVPLGTLLPGGRPDFDLVLDLGTPPQLGCESPPFGYYAPQGDARALRAALEALPELVGEFEKPKFFVYDPDVCAHGNSGLQGCTRCLEVCPTQAIRSLGALVEVDPYLCQGAGSCATACPTGAIRYAEPTPDDLLSYLRRLLAAYREAGGRGGAILLHDAEAGAECLAAGARALPESVFPIELPEIGSAGIEVWLAALAYGAEAVYLLVTAHTPRSVSRELDLQLEVAQAVLAGLGDGAGAVRRIAAPAELRAVAEADRTPAGFASFGGKREVFRLALQHLHAHAPAPQDAVALPAGAPFGALEVDRQACTLCMACVSVCPAGALLDGGEQPRLAFKESHCVQCGLCAQACPEDAIALQPRMAYAAHLQPGAQTVLNEDAPLHCAVCGKPFGTQKMVERIAARLAGHWMFQDPQAQARLRMCEDCRVHDIFARSGGLEVYDKPG